MATALYKLSPTQLSLLIVRAATATNQKIGSFRVPVRVPARAFLAILAFPADRIFSNLRGFNKGGRPESRRPRHSI